MLVQIVCVRHPEKKDDCITAHGAMQAYAAALALAEAGFKFGRIVVSGANLTKQAARVMAAALDMDPDIPLDVWNGFHYQKTMDEVFCLDADSTAAIKREIELLKAAHDGKPTLANALAVSAYARQGRSLVRKTLEQLALDMCENEETGAALVLSHSPWLELGANPGETPYGIGESDAIVYSVAVYELGVDKTMEAVTLDNTRLIKAPMPGKTN